MEYLLDDYGQDKMLDLLALFKQGNTHDEALAEVYGFDIDGLDAGWRGTLSNSATQAPGVWLHPALVAVFAALATALALAGALALEGWTWWRLPGKPTKEDKL